MAFAKILTGVLALTMTFCAAEAISLNASATETESSTLTLREGYAITSDWAYFKTTDSEAEIVRYDGDETNVVIPSELDGYTITAITGCSEIYESDYHMGVYCGAFENSEIESVSIPDSVTTIGKSAFFNCTELDSIYVPSSVTEIGDEALGYAIFANSTNPIRQMNNFSITCESGTAASDYAKTNGFNHTFTDLILREGYALNGYWVYYKTSDSEAEIVRYNGDETNVVIPSELDGYTITAITGCSEIYESDNRLGIYCGAFEDSYVESVIIPDSVTTIGDYAFAYCDSLESVILGNSVKSIGVEAFGACTSLTSITIPDSVTSIGHYAFAGCDKLTIAKIGNSVTSIGDAAFVYCDNLESVTLGNSVKKIGINAFDCCPNLKSVTIPKSVTSLGDCAFGYAYDESTDEFVMIEGFTITCYQNTAAHTYAINNRFNCNLLDAAPSNVSGLKLTSNTASSIKMTWNKVNGATGYVVYQAIGGKWQRIKVTSANSLTVSNLKAGTNYRFTVRAYKTVSGKNYYSPSYTGVWMTTLPANVSGFKVSATSAQAVKLTWNKVNGATGYVVYRAIGGKWQRVGVVKTNSFYEGKLASGTNYRYAVRAYKTFNGKNYYSAKYPTLWTSTKPATVSFKVTAGTKKATVSWSKVTGATGYKVYYKTSANGSWKGLKTTTGRSFTKTGLTSGKTYYFTVKAYKTFNGTTYNGSYTTKSVKVK